MDFLARNSNPKIITPCFIGMDINGRKLYPLMFPSPQSARTINGASEPQPNPHTQFCIGVIILRTHSPSRTS